MFGMDVRVSYGSRLVGTGLAGALAAGCLAAAGPAGAADGSVFPSNYTFPNGDRGFFLEAQEFRDIHGNLIDPCWLVGFTSRSMPTGYSPSPIDLSIPGNPVLMDPNTGPFTVQFAMIGLGNGRMPFPAAPNSDGFTSFHQMFDGHALDVSLRFGPGPLVAGSWVAFNPQPDPPGDILGIAMTFPSDPYFSFSVTFDGQPLTFTLAPVPEPASWATMLLGFAGLGLALRASRRKALAA